MGETPMPRLGQTSPQPLPEYRELESDYRSLAFVETAL